MERMTSRSTIWRVTIHEDNGVDTDTYYFWNRDDVITSIHTTWSKRKDEIGITDTPMKIAVYETGLFFRTLLEAEPITIGYLIHDRPTHF